MEPAVNESPKHKILITFSVLDRLSASLTAYRMEITNIAKPIETTKGLRLVHKLLNMFSCQNKRDRLVYPKVIRRPIQKHQDVASAGR